MKFNSINFLSGMKPTDGVLKIGAMTLGIGIYSMFWGWNTFLVFLFGVCGFAFFFVAYSLAIKVEKNE